MDLKDLLTTKTFEVKKLPKDGERKMYLDLIAKLTERKIPLIAMLTRDWPDSWVKDSYEEALHAKDQAKAWWSIRKKTLVAKT